MSTTDGTSAVPGDHKADPGSQDACWAPSRSQSIHTVSWSHTGIFYAAPCLLRNYGDPGSSTCQACSPYYRTCGCTVWFSSNGTRTGPSSPMQASPGHRLHHTGVPKLLQETTVRTPG